MLKKKSNFMRLKNIYIFINMLFLETDATNKIKQKVKINMKEKTDTSKLHF